MGVEDAIWFVMVASLILEGEEDPEGFDICLLCILKVLSLSRSAVPGAADLGSKEAREGAVRENGWKAATPLAVQR